MNPTQAFILQSAMNQRGTQPGDMNTMGLPPGMNVPPPAGAPVAPNIPGPSSNFRPMPMKPQQEAPRAQPTMGNAAMQAIPEMQGMQQQSDDSPIFKGIKSAMDAGRESYKLTDEQRNRAEGEAIMAFFGNMAKSQNSSVLGSMSESFMPALAQYNAAEARGMGLNKEVIDTQLKREHEQRLLDASLAKAGGAGGMKVGNQISILQSYNTRAAAIEDKRDKLMSQAYANLSEEQRQNPAILAQLETMVEQRLQPDIQALESLKNYALANGFDINAAMGNVQAPPMNAPAIENPALNVSPPVNQSAGGAPVFKGKTLKQIKAERAALAAQAGSQ